MIAIISCAKSKYHGQDIEARQLYWKSNLFRLSYKVIKARHPGIPIYILSAKYGLIPELKHIGTYEQTIKTMTKAEKIAMRESLPLHDDYIFIGGSEYKSVLPYPPFLEYGKGLPIGKKMQYLKSLL